MYYIQRKDNRCLETVDEFTTRKIEAATPAMEIQPEPVAHVVGAEAQEVPMIDAQSLIEAGFIPVVAECIGREGLSAYGPAAQAEILEKLESVKTQIDATSDDQAKFNIRAKNGTWFACVYMVGAMYGLRFEAICGPQGCTTYATHAERMQALEVMAKYFAPPTPTPTPPDGGQPIATDDAPTEAPASPVAECTQDTPVAISSASDAPLHPRSIIPTNGLHIVDDAFEAWTYQHQYPSGTRFGFVMYLGKSAKPWKYYGYKSEAARDEGFERHATEARDIAAFKAKRKAEDKAKAEQGHGLQVGDVVRSEWGYEQTNINHYQVTKLIGKCTVEVRELAGIIDRERDMS